MENAKVATAGGRQLRALNVILTNSTRPARKSHLQIESSTHAAIKKETSGTARLN
jgi:hypothetical protein